MMFFMVLCIVFNLFMLFIYLVCVKLDIWLVVCFVEENVFLSTINEIDEFISEVKEF